jgi:hypothetical protein
MSQFNDTTPRRLALRIDAGALQALKDHPALLAPADPGMHFALAVRRGVEALRAATEIDGPIEHVPKQRRDDVRLDGSPVPAEDDDLRHALQWALSWIERSGVEPDCGAAREDYTGAERIAWPDEPENWSPESAPTIDTPPTRGL